MTNETKISQRVEIPQEEFSKQIQDVGCTKEELKVKRYRAMMIPVYGKKEYILLQSRKHCDRLQ